MRRRAFDIALALVLVALGLGFFSSFADRRAFDHVILGAALVVVHAGAVAWRRRAPLTVLGVNVASGVAFCAIGFPPVALGVALPVALYTAGGRVERRRSLPALVVTVTAMVATLRLSSPDTDASTLAGNALVLVVAWFLGDTQRARRLYVRQLEERTAELEAAREELAQQAVARERLRIARELHDVVAHSMGTIAVQAGVGRHVIDARPDEAKRSLEAIEGTSKSALGEIRRMLGLLRSGDDPAEIAPSPGLADLPRLVSEVEGTGVTVELHAEQPPSPLPDGIDLTIYRLVQEALTNVVRHAGATRARVAVWFPDGTARIEVVDDGRGSSPAVAAGHGILGMRERVAMHGGSLDTGPLPERGFRVAATLPRDGGAS